MMLCERHYQEIKKTSYRWEENTCKTYLIKDPNIQRTLKIQQWENQQPENRQKTWTDSSQNKIYRWKASIICH